MDNSNNLYSEDDEFAVPETQESPATFSKNIIRRLGIRRTSSGTDAADPNSNTNINVPTSTSYVCSYVCILLLCNICTVFIQSID